MPDDTVTVPEKSGEAPWTRREIVQQPATLRDTQALLRAQAEEIGAFVAPLLARPEMRIVLTGAGTSAFIGESLAPWLSFTLDREVEAVATTDIVSAPDLHLRAGRPTLLVSFGRSGSSPESVAAVDLADARLAEVHHLVVTCNAGGDLARRGGARRHVVILPEATHDRGFAMTSSFSAMMLAALSIFTGIERFETRAAAIADGVGTMLVRADAEARSLAARGFSRVVYLGSGVFRGLAREAALKLLELSDGRVVTAFDSSLGFRHGPKTIVDAETLVVVFVSSDPLTRLYDLDILAELRGDARCGAVLAIGAQPLDGEAVVLDDATSLSDAELLFPFVVFAQLFGLHVSERLGLTPDRPNASGTVHRVVQGVRIHAATA